MASEVGVGYVRLIPSMRGFSAEAQRALGGPLQQVAGQVGEQSGRALTDRMSSSMRQAGGAMTAAISAPLAGVGTAVVMTAADFEKSMNGVRAVTGVTGTDFEALRDQAKDLGASTQFSATEAANAMEFLGMAGWDATQIMSGLPDVLNLAAAGGTDLATSADIASNIMSGFGIEAEDMARVSDVLATTLTSTNVNMESLGESMKYAAPLAKSAGWSLEETAAAVGFLGNAGIQGSMAGTGLNSILATLSDTSSTGGKRLAEFGVAAQDSTGQVRPLTDILDDLADGGADVADVIGIFGLEAGPKMQALLGQGSEGIRELIGDLETSEGAAKEMANIRMEGFSGSLMELKSAFQGLLIAIGESGILEWATAFAEKLTGLVSRLTETDSSALRVATVLGLVAAAAGPLLVVFSMAINQVAGAARAMAAFGRGTVTVVTGFARMTAATAGFIGRMAVVAVQFTATMLRMAATMAVTAARVVAGWIRMGVQALIQAGRMAAAWVIAMGPIGWITAAVIGLALLIAANWETVKAATLAVWNWVWEKIQWVVEQLVNAFMNFTPVGLIIQHWETIKTRTSAAWNGIVAWVRKVPGRIVRGFASLGSSLWETARSAFQSFRTSAGQRVTAMITWVKGIPKRIVRGLGNLKTLLVSSGKDVVRGLWNGISSMGRWISEKVSGFVSSVIPGPVKGALGISSPSKLMRDEVGRWIPEGIIAGISSGERGVARAMSTLVPAPQMPPALTGGQNIRTATAPVPEIVFRADGGRASRLLVELIQHSVRTELGGDVGRLAGRRG